MGINWFPHWRSIESGGGYIKSVTLEDHEQALAEKDREIVKWSELIGSFTRSQHRYLMEMERLKQALAEKDLELELADFTIKESLEKIAAMDKEIQQIREHEFQRGYQEAEEKYQQIYEGGCPHDSLGDQARTIEQQAQEIARLREALENIVEGEGLWTKNDMAHEAQQALKETGK